MTHDEIEEFRRARRLAGQAMDPETAEVCWKWVPTLDPYVIIEDLPEEAQQVGREYFARAPGSDVWVCFSDFPEAARERLWEKYKNKLTFPHGNPGAIAGMDRALLAALGVTEAEIAAAESWAESVEGLGPHERDEALLRYVRAARGEV